MDDPLGRLLNTTLMKQFNDSAHSVTSTTLPNPPMKVGHKALKEFNLDDLCHPNNVHNILTIVEGDDFVENSATRSEPFRVYVVPVLERHQKHFCPSPIGDRNFAGKDSLEASKEAWCKFAIEVAKHSPTLTPLRVASRMSSCMYELKYNRDIATYLNDAVNERCGRIPDYK